MPDYFCLQGILGGGLWKTELTRTLQSIPLDGAVSHWWGSSSWASRGMHDLEEVLVPFPQNSTTCLHHSGCKKQRRGEGLGWWALGAMPLSGKNCTLPMHRKPRQQSLAHYQHLFSSCHCHSTSSSPGIALDSPHGCTGTVSGLVPSPEWLSHPTSVTTISSCPGWSWKSSGWTQLHWGDDTEEMGSKGWIVEQKLKKVQHTGTPRDAWSRPGPESSYKVMVIWHQREREHLELERWRCVWVTASGYR